MKVRLLFLGAWLSACLRLFAGDSVVVFNELMYQPSSGDSIEWVELYNQMAVDVEIGGWRIDGADYIFPADTIIRAGEYVVVASEPVEMTKRTGLTNLFGPLGGKLANEGERLSLINHNGREMDSVSYDSKDRWPTGPAGSGFTLAKKSPVLGSKPAESWSASAQPGGTPGRVNFSSIRAEPQILLSEIPAVTNSSRWVELHNLGTNDASLDGLQLEFSKSTLPPILLSDQPAIPAGGFRVIDLSTYNYAPKAGEKIFLLRSEPRELLDAGELPARTVGRSFERDDKWRFVRNETPGSQNDFQLQNDIVINEIMYRNRPVDPASAEYKDSPLVALNAAWRFDQSGTERGLDWVEPAFSDTTWPAGLALLAVESASLPAPIATPLKLGVTTYRFRTEFQFDGNTNGIELGLEHVVDDGAVFYLNGREIYRVNMPEGAVNSATFANVGVPDASLIGPVSLPGAALVQGRNVLAVEVHQNSTGSSDIVFGCRLSARQLVHPARGFSESSNNWVELFNKGTNAIDLSAWELKGTGYIFQPGTLLDSGAYLVIAQDAALFAAENPGVRVLGNFEKKLSRGSDSISLIDSAGNIADEVRYYDEEPWPEAADGLGSSLELKNPAADNSKAETWAQSLNPGTWETISYTGVASPDNGPTRWHEFVFGLLDAGEVLLDDISVIEDPAGAKRQLLQNGNFENGDASWRILGTHRASTVITDPENPANHILRIVADGPTEHMHNHIETTLVNGTAIRNGTTYTISFRAKWISGSNKLNTRLYHNRVAKTTVLSRPASSGSPGRQNSVYVENPGPTFSGFVHTPAVPKPSQTVAVSVTPDDPEGVVRCTLWWAASGKNWTSVPMSSDNGRYSGTIPARTAATVIQFYVEAEDSRGAVATYPAQGRDSRALYKVNDNQALSARMHNFRLIMLPSEASLLHASTNVMSNGRSLCTVIYDESEVFYNCGLHLQSSERGRMEANRVGFTVSFPADHLFRGVQDTITFDRSGGWSGKVSSRDRQDEILMRHVINHAGDSPDMYNDLVRVLTPLTTHTGTAMLLMAKYGGSFIDGSVYPKDGTLFKLELIYSPTTSVNNDPQEQKIPQPDDVVGVEIGNLGDNKEAYRWFFVTENHPDRDDYSGMIDLAQAFSLSGAALEARTSELMNMEQWTRTFAFKTLSGDADTYGFGYPHNQLIYIPPASTDGVSPRPRALAFPWDMDYGWTRGANDSINVGGRIGQIIHGIPANQRLFLGNVEDITRTSFNAAYMTPWVTHYGAVSGENFSGILSYIGQRSVAARAQLPKPAAFRITSFNGQDVLTNGISVNLRGSAPYLYKRLQRNHDVPGEGFSWPAVETWQTTFPLEYGVNHLTITAWDFHNNAVATNSITIVSTATAGRPDRDGDGMPDSWETQNGLDPDNSADSHMDFDGDGLENLAEYLAGLSPLDRTSRLELQAETTGASTLALSFWAKPGRAYKLQYRLGLETAWKDLSKIPPGFEERLITQNQTITPLAPVMLYRLVLEN